MNWLQIVNPLSMFGYQNSACLCEPQASFLRRGKLQNAGDASQKALLMTPKRLVVFASRKSFSCGVANSKTRGMLRKKRS
jgi:hypothetical protein